MANVISNDSADESVFLQLSNGGMSVVVSTLALSGSHLAKEKHEIDLVTWIASRDQGVLGSGVVGFDLVDLPWAKTEEAFGQQKQFMLRVIGRIREKEDFCHLDYDPPYVDEYMDKLEILFTSFLFRHVGDEEPSWWLPPDEQLTKCEKHGLYMHVSGCVVCNDQ